MTTDRAEAVTISVDPEWQELRDGVRRICDDFPNEYWVN